VPKTAVPTTSPTRPKTEPTHSEKRPRPTLPQPGDIIRATVAFIDKSGKVDLEILDFPNDLMGYIQPQNVAGKKYQEGQTISCEVIALNQQHGETVVECRPAGAVSQTGEVVKFNAERGYGFIQPDGGGKQLFVHKNRFAPGLSILRERERVRFKVGKGMKGPEAQDVRREE
jgi:CspA family cold shock protein